MSVKKAPMNVYRSRTFGMLAACVGILLSSPAHALSLGGFRVSSALDEPLRAEITLQSVDSETLESLEIKLGSGEDFQRAAVPRPEFLQQLEFTVSAEGDEAVVVVTTEQPVTEPFLHFLIAAEWSGGKLVREYTGLLDPPLYAAETPSSVEAPATGEAPRPAVSSTEARPEPADPEAGSPGPSSTELNGAPGRSAEYGPTLAGDTLWDIASRLQTGSLQVNVFQIMIALLRENPDAFVDNNINRLKTDQILRLPDLGSIADVAADEASAVYTAQLQEWQAYKTRLADAGVGDEVEIAGDAASTAMATEGTVAGAASAEATGEVDSGQAVEAGREAGQGADQGADQGAADQDDVLRIVQATLDESQQSEAAGAGSDRSAEVAELRGQIATLEESLESRTLANEELRERVRLLESQLENAQRLIQIESEELAAAQQQAAERQDTAEEPMPEESVAGAPDEAGAGDESGDQTATAPAAETDASQAGAVSSTTGGEEARAQDTQTSQQAGAAAAPASQAASEASQGGGRVTRVVNRPPRASWWSSIPDLLFSSWMWMVGAGAGVLVLVLGLLMFLRRRQSIAEFEESILSGKGLDSYSETTDTAGASASDTSFLSDFGTAGMGTMQADEVDPLAEAEVYLAYGRDEQAEEVLKEAARRDPDRSEIKLKLLEIYKQRNDVKSFETIAEELYPASEQEDPEIWRRVNAMGRELNPDNPLFQESEKSKGAATAPAAAAPAAAGAVDDLNFDLDDSGPERAPTTAGAGSPAEPEEQSTGGMDMEPEPATAPASRTETVRASTQSDDDVLDLGDEFLERSTRNVDPSTQPFPAPDQQADLDRELERLASERDSATARLAPGGESEPGAGDDTPSHEVAWETAQSESPTLDFPASDTSEIDFNLNLDESSIPSEPGMDSQPADEKSADEQREPLDTSEGLLEFESDYIPPQETWAGPSSDASPGDEDSLPYSPDDDAQSTGAPQYNEAETKLDLARAYLDMGDKVGARSIIDEVMREGDPAQRDRAAELASQL